MIVGSFGRYMPRTAHDHGTTALNALAEAGLNSFLKPLIPLRIS